jgi:hypothetical protein
MAGTMLCALSYTVILTVCKNLGGFVLAPFPWGRKSHLERLRTILAKDIHLVSSIELEIELDSSG